MSARDSRIFEKGELGFLRELARARVDFMIVGLSAAALQGAPVVTQDVDLWFRDPGDPGIQKALRKAGGIYVPPTDSRPPAFAGDAVELFDFVVHMHGLGTFAEEKKNVIRLRVGSVTVPVLKLARILESKRFLGRPKDRLYLRVLADTLKALQGRRAPRRSPRK